MHTSDAAGVLSDGVCLCLHSTFEQLCVAASDRDNDDDDDDDDAPLVPAAPRRSAEDLSTTAAAGGRRRIAASVGGCVMLHTIAALARRSRDGDAVASDTAGAMAVVYGVTAATPAATPAAEEEEEHEQGGREDRGDGLVVKVEGGDNVGVGDDGGDRDDGARGSEGAARDVGGDKKDDEEEEEDEEEDDDEGEGAEEHDSSLRECKVRRAGGDVGERSALGGLRSASERRTLVSFLSSHLPVAPQNGTRSDPKRRAHRAANALRCSAVRFPHRRHRSHRPRAFASLAAAVTAARTVSRPATALTCRKRPLRV